MALCSVRQLTSKIESLKLRLTPPCLALAPLDFALSTPQQTLYDALQEDECRYLVIVAGRRFGKTHWACVVMLKAAWKRPSRIWYIAPTYSQAEGIAWLMLKSLIPREYIFKINETKLRMTLINKSVIELKGADKPDSLRGPGLDLVIFDEYANVKEEAWDVIRPTLMAQKNQYGEPEPGKTCFVGTPDRGFDSFYDLYKKAETEKFWRSYHYTSEEGGRISSEQLALAKQQMSPDVYNIEMMGAWEQLSGRVFKSFSRPENIWDGVRDMGGKSILIGLDFNRGINACVIGCRCGTQLHIFQEYVGAENTAELCKQILKDFKPLTSRTPEVEKWVSTPLADRARVIKIYPDASGNSRKTSAVAGETDFTILRRAGFKIFAPRANPPVIDRYNATNALLCNAAGDRNLLIHPRCTNLINSLEKLVWKKDSNVVQKNSGKRDYSHFCDALGYLIYFSGFNIYKRGLSIRELIL